MGAGVVSNNAAADESVIHVVAFQTEIHVKCESWTPLATSSHQRLTYTMTVVDTDVLDRLPESMV